MALTDHIAILTHHALAQATPNQKKAGKPLEFYGLIAFPPAAMNDLAAVAATVTNGAPLANFEIGISTNAQAKKPIVGIPGDWFVVRAATQFAPYVADAAGNQLDQQNPAHISAIKSTFFAGKRVRAALTAFSWIYDGRHGISFNLAGVMDAGEESARLAIGNGEMLNAFQKHANPNAAPAAIPGANAQPVAAPNTGNPFGGQTQVQQQQTAAPAASANPFAQQTQASSNPFATA